VREEINRIFVKHTNQPFEKISIDTERDFYMTAEQAKDYGIVDEIVEKRK
jgi:ATP-dependent Clp protease protease subunit